MNLSGDLWKNMPNLSDRSCNIAGKLEQSTLNLTHLAFGLLLFQQSHHLFNDTMDMTWFVRIWNAFILMSIMVVIM